MSDGTKTLVPGLAGVPAAESAISFINGEAGILEYRGYPIEALGEHCSFEETAWLLMHGELPTALELADFEDELVQARRVPASLIETIRGLPAKGHPMDALQVSVAALGMYRNPNSTPEQDCIHLLAAMPVLIAAFHRARIGAAHVEPDPELGHAANFLWMMNGEKPAELAAQVLDVALVLHADHTMNASTFAGRVVGATEADAYTTVASAIGALTGPLHGGANERVLNSLEAIGSVDDVEAWFAAKLAKRDKVMGFGHRVYSVKDPRATAIQGLVRRLFEELGSTPLYDVAKKLEEEVTKHLGAKGIYPNVDFFSGIVYQKLGIPTDQFTPVFALARVAGWLAHWREQMSDNRLFRPGQIYTGHRQREMVAIEDR